MIRKVGSEIQSVAASKGRENREKEIPERLVVCKTQAMPLLSLALEIVLAPRAPTH